MSTNITFGNFKGGTGKTTNSVLISYHLARKGYKTLLVDLDPQANATSLLLKTAQSEHKETISFPKTLMTAISEENLSQIVTPIINNLFLLPGFADFTSYPLFLEKKFPDSQKDRIFFLKQLITPIEDHYDFIIFDVPPTLSAYTDSSMVASDYIVIVLQTQERSLVGAEAFIQYTQELYNTYTSDVNFDIVGLLPVLLKNTSPVDQTILEQSKEKFGSENLFENVVRNMERVKRYDLIGITNPDNNHTRDMHDLRLHALYSNITDELLERIDK
ncbi:AAA family ATPase [Fructobacillus cardui]|uniref:ParA-like ATPase involved in chromosome/plasmid partitioning or cellulose biosynthesis protein BcsQ (ParA) n=1 Tax=Fructobacillus cardui TaxID=2893170 RepID=A0ABN9Z431_9LACO|nr:ParA-like ATPase involved in chromosome/plasmid partitioning or cellulose biosynthesis protein BcsQ (ParA) [Fructobacillus cardui]